jgi:Tfp pilus assembly protein PilZ
VTPRERLFVDGVTARLEGDGLRVANLSLGGLFAATDRPPLLGQVVKLELDVDDRGPYEVLGRVTWVNEGHAPKAPDLPKGFGVRITQIGLPAKLAIVNALKRTRDRLRGEA